MTEPRRSFVTIDIDTTIQELPLTLGEIRNILHEIMSVSVDDGIVFSITKYGNIMEEHDYPGLRFFIEAKLESLRQSICIDISTGDIITPGAVENQYQLIFEERTIPMWTYNLETLLAEKIETIVSRGLVNTRMRDFYDLYILTINNNKVDLIMLQKALKATSERRNSYDLMANADENLNELISDASMRKMWDSFRDYSFFVGDLKWEILSSYARKYINRVLSK